MAKPKQKLPALRLPTKLPAHQARAAALAREEARRRGVPNDDYAIYQYFYVFILKYTPERQERELEQAHTRVLLHRFPRRG